MPSGVEQLAAAEAMWDLPRIFRNSTNQDGSGAAAFQLSPTALLAACWALDCPNTAFGYLFRLTFSTDTAIAWTLYKAAAGTGLTARAKSQLGSTLAAAQTFQAQVAAAPAVVAALDGGYAAANSHENLIPGMWLQLPGNSALVLATAAVAANCYVSMWWAAYTV